MFLGEFYTEEFYVEPLNNLYFNLDLIFLTIKLIYMRKKRDVARISRATY